MRSFRRAVAASFALACGAASFLAVSSGCGFDLAGTLESTLSPAGDGGSSALDAGGDHEVTVSGDASASADAGKDAGPKPPGPCEDPAMILCVGFDGALVDEAHAQPVAKAGTVSFVPGVVGQAVLLDATSALTVADGPAWTYTSLTVEMWVRRDQAPPFGGRAGLLDKDSSFGIFTYADGTVSCILGGTVTGPVFGASPAWVHVACVNDGVSTTLYADGVAKGTIASGGLVTTTALAAIGNNSPNLGSPLIGAIDLLRVYSRGKTAAEIAADAMR